MKLIKKRPITWSRKRITTEYSLPELVIIAAMYFAAWSLLIYAFTSGVEDIWGDLVISETDSPGIFLTRIMCASIFGVGIPYFGKSINGKLGAWPGRIVAIAGIIISTVMGITWFWPDGYSFNMGFYGFAGRYIESFNNYHGVTYYLPAGDAGYYSAWITSILIAVTIMCWSLAYLIDSRLFWIIIPVAGYVAQMLAGEVPGWGSIGSFLVGTLIILMLAHPKKYAGTLRSRKRYRDRFYRKTEFKQGVASLIAILAVVTLVSTAFSGLAGKVTGNNNSVKKFQKNMEKAALTAVEYIKVADSEDITEEITDKPPVFLDESIGTLTVSTAVHDNIYIREYIGSHYTDGAWHYNPKTFDEACKDMDFDAQTVRKQLEMLAFSGLGGAERANGADFYLEYGDHVTTSALSTYFTDITPGAHVLNSDVLPRKGILATHLDSRGLKGASLTAGDIVMLSEKKYPAEEEKILKWYDKFVLNHYVYGAESVPTAGEAAAYMKKTYLNKDNVSINRWRMRMAEQVAVLLSAYTFDWNLDAAPEGTDTMEYFLTQGHQGYNIHFATAGALILQEMGIPARYASGYVVNGDFFKKNDDGSRSTIVLDRDLHAWVEVYLNHIGWVPVEVCPSYRIRDDYMKTGQEYKKLRDKPVLKMTADDPALKPWQVGATASDDPDANTWVDWSSLGNRQPDDVNNSDMPGPDSGNFDNIDNRDSDMPDSMDNLNDSDQSETKEPEIDEDKEQDNGSDAEKEESPEDIKGLDSPTETENPMNSDDDGLAIPEPEEKPDFGEMIKVLLIGLGKILGILLIIGAAAVAVTAIVGWLINRHYRKKIETAYAAGNYGEVVRTVNRRLYLKLRFTGHIFKLYPTDAEYRDVLKEVYDKVAPSKWDTFIEIAKEASFSDKEISAEKAEFCYKLLK